MTDDETRPMATPLATESGGAAQPIADDVLADGPSARAVQTQRVRGTTASRARTRSRTRWAIASLVTALVLVVSAAGFMILSAGAATSALVGYVPANSIGYLEIRLDAPGDQRQNAANLLSHFPGFADQSSLGTKLDEALDQLVGTASSGKQSFTSNVKAWLGDSVALAMTRLSTTAPTAAAGHARSGLLLVSVKDPTGARAWADSTFGAATATETYGGIALASLEARGMTLDYGVISNVLLVGDPQSVHDAIDSKGAGAFGDSASFKAAAAAVPGDRLAFGFLDLHLVGQAVASARTTTATATAMTFDQLPAWVAVTVRAESDALSATVALPDTSLAPVAANHTSLLATKLPASTIAAGEIHDLAALLSTLTTTFRGSSAGSDSQDQLDQALQALGGFDSLVGWMGDATVALVPSTSPAGSIAGGSSSSWLSDISAGVVVQAKDAAAADTRVTQLKNLVSVAGAPVGVTLSDETYNGTTISVIDLGALTSAVLPPAMAGVAANAAPSVRIAVAQKDDLVIVGIGDAFVKAVLDTRTGASLADQDAYRSALSRAGSSNTGQLFVDIHAVMDLVVSNLSPDQQRRYESDIKPYLDPFRAFAASGSAGDPNRARILITVK